MSTLLFPKRNGELIELMDNPACDPGKLANTYRYFATINALVAGWRSIYLTYIRPLQPRTLLDIGCGGGDIVRQLATWAKQDGLELTCTAIEPDQRAINFALSLASPANIHFLQADAAELVKQGKTFDIVISNHVLHHLESQELRRFCELSEKLSLELALHNDIRRHDLAYLAFSLTAPFFRKSFITPDGLTSIKRSYTQQELAGAVPDKWQVKAGLPFRNLLIFRK